MHSKQPTEQLFVQEKLPYQYYEQTIVSKIHHFYLSQLIEEPSKYADMVFRIQAASPDDVVYIHLNTPGGNLGTGVQLVNAINLLLHMLCVVSKVKLHPLEQ